MRKAVWALAIGALGLLTVLFFVPTPPGIPVPDFRMEVHFNSSHGFEEVIPKLRGGYAKLAIAQGKTGSIPITLRRQYTTKTIEVLIWLQGVAPDFDQWVIGAAKNAGLPEGMTYAINPCTFVLKNNDVHNVTLKIALSPEARTGNFKLTIAVCRIRPGGGAVVSYTGKSLILEVRPRRL